MGRRTWTTYRLTLRNPGSQAAIPETLDSTVNTPLTTSLVVVEHTPAGGGSPETWKVYPDSAVMGLTDGGSPAMQVGALLQDAKRSWVNVGQFGMPFPITITRK